MLSSSNALMEGMELCVMHSSEEVEDTTWV